MKITTSILLASLVAVTMAGCTNQSDKQESATDSTTTALAVHSDPLSSWNDVASKKAIIDFVSRTTKEGSTDFIPVEARIACFDNDGTLWSEQPMYFQFLFALDRVKELAPQHPEWKTKEPFKSLLNGDIKKAVSGGDKALFQIIAATHGGMSNDEFASAVKNWMATATHPRLKKHYNELIFQPMLEVLNYLRANGFKTYIVSGGDQEFMRAWAEDAYGIPPEQVIGSEMKIVYEVKNDTPQLMRLPEMSFVDDGPGKPVAINEQIGKRPVFTAGNSDGDYQMLQYTSTGTGVRFGMIVHHTDSVREWSYDRNSSIGHLEKGLDDASKYEWIVVDMKNDWNVIYPFQQK